MQPRSTKKLAADQRAWILIIAVNVGATALVWLLFLCISLHS